MCDIKNDRQFFFSDDKATERHLSKKAISAKQHKIRHVRRSIEDLHLLREIKQQSCFDLSGDEEILKSYFNTSYK